MSFVEMSMQQLNRSMNGKRLQRKAMVDFVDMTQLFQPIKQYCRLRFAQSAVPVEKLPP